MKMRGVLVIIFLIMAGVIAYGLLIESFSSGDSSRTFDFTYYVKLNNVPEDARQISILMPVPQSDQHQLISDIRVDSPYPYRYVTDNEYGNRALEINVDGGSIGSLETKIMFSANRKNYAALDGSMRAVDVPNDVMRRRYLSADHLVPLDGPVLAEAHRVVKPEMSDLEKARAIYDDVVSTMRYDKSGTGWGRGDAIYACDVRAGNCTDFHSLFIGMARASGIPARFIMGFPLPEDQEEGEIAGYHCWAEFYTDELGWVPVDASEASKFPEKRDYFFGSIDENRIAFTTGRDINLGLAELPEPLNYLIYPIVLVDGKKHEDVERRFAFANRKIERII